MPGAELEATKDNLAALFKSERSKIDALFNGSSVALKRDLSQEEAQKYVDVLQRAGAEVRAETEFASTLSLVETEEHDALPVTETMTCPKCGHEQLKAGECSACGIVIEKYLARQAQISEASASMAPAAIVAAPGASPYSAPQSQVSDSFADVGELNPFGVQGRIGRLRYIAWSFVMMLAFIPVYGLAIGAMIGISEVVGGLLIAVVLIGAIVFGVFIGGQRLHDIGWSAWLWLLNLVPFVGFIFTILMLVMPGTPGPNRYGPPPPANSTAVLVLAWLMLGVTILSVLASIALPVIVGMAMAS